MTAVAYLLGTIALAVAVELAMQAHSRRQEERRAQGA